MDQLDRLFQRLVHNIRSRNPSHLPLPFTVAELYEQIVPYRHNRRELGMETNQDYELTVMRLLAGEREYLLGDAAMQEALRRELQSRDPDTSAFREYGTSEVSISPTALEQLGAARRRSPAAGPARDGEARQPQATPATKSPPQAAASAMAENPPASTGAQTAASAATPTSPETPPTTRGEVEISTAQEPTQCRFCGTGLPQGREVKFCPNCGQNLAISRCPACGSEIEAGWKFCITCGREAGT
jgi:predicted RNA-binding Zn-ribbon protein involved in translation (DUF1610 family)